MVLAAPAAALLRVLSHLSLRLAALRKVHSRDVIRLLTTVPLPSESRIHPISHLPSPS